MKKIISLSIVLLLLSAAILPTESTSAQDGAFDNLVTWGQPGDRPFVGDFNGDGRDDLGLYRPASASWHFDFNQDGVTDIDRYDPPWGQADDLPFAGDFDGDGHDDLGLFHPADGSWVFDFDLNGTTDWFNYGWGAPGDMPLVGDINGDGRDDVGLFLYQDNRWEFDFNLDGVPDNHRSAQWGERGDLPFAGDFDGNGQSDKGLLHVYSGTWSFDHNLDGQTDRTLSMTGAIASGDYPVTGDCNHDGAMDIAVFRDVPGLWFMDYGTRASTVQATSPVTVTFNPTSIEAVIIEEPTSGSDEVYIIYSLLVKEGASTRVVNRAWGVYAMTSGDIIRQAPSGPGQWLKPLTLENVPGNAEIWVEVRVMESENDEYARSIINSVNTNSQQIMIT
jgi:hypothetical protein